MKKILVLAALLGFGALVWAGCGKKEQVQQETVAPRTEAGGRGTKTDTLAAYYCPMDPEITSDKPDKCSKCGMDLIEKPAETK